MPTLPVPFADIRRAVTEYHQALDAGFPPPTGKHGGELTASAVAGTALGLEGPNRTKTVARYLDTATALGIEVRSWRRVDEDWAGKEVRRYRTYDTEFQDAESRLSRPGTPRPGTARAGRTGSNASAVPAGGQPSGRAPSPTISDDPLQFATQVVPLLRRGPLTVEEVAEQFKTDQMTAFSAIMIAHKQGASVAFRAGKWHLDAAPATGSQAPRKPFQLVTDTDGYVEFGASGDQHLCSKYERLDCLNDYYDQLARREISVVLSAGNHVDGESSFNRHDIVCHGMDQQMQYLARNFPQRAGIETWAITGEDHEGWWARREGVDVGRYTENVMRENGRQDWHDLGFMECFIPLVHGDTGKSSQLCLMHPGGGSAYAISYAPQKIVEGFDGGAKPAVLLIGHYHKASYQLTRNVHTLQTGTFCDQTLFMRQKKLAAHVGGWFCKLHVDPETGAVDEFTCTFRNYFVKDFYAGRWSEHGRAVPVLRSPIP